MNLVTKRAGHKTKSKENAIASYLKLQCGLNGAKSKGNLVNISYYGGLLAQRDFLGQQFLEVIESKNLRKIANLLHSMLSDEAICGAMKKASEMGNMRILKLLVPSIKALYGHSLFYKSAEHAVWNAIYCNHLAAFNYLVGEGANLEVMLYDQTYLHLAASKGRLEMAKTLVEKTGGRLINKKNSAGSTPLDFAMLEKHSNVEAYLKKEGAQPGELFKGV